MSELPDLLRGPIGRAGAKDEGAVDWPARLGFASRSRCLDPEGECETPFSPEELSQGTGGIFRLVFVTGCEMMSGLGQSPSGGGGGGRVA